MKRSGTVAFLTAAILMPVTAGAQLPQDAITLTTSGDACTAINPRKGLRAIQRIRGAIANISED